MTLPITPVRDPEPDNLDNPLGNVPDLELAVGEITRHASGYQKAYKYWRGTQTEVFASPNLKATLHQAGADEYRISVGKRVVAAVTDRLEVTSVDVDDTATEALEAVTKANRMDIKLPDLFQKAVTYGDMYVTVWPDPDDPNVVEIVLRSPENMRTFYDTENEDKARFTGLTWLQPDKRRRVTLFYPDRIERYIGRKAEQGSTPTDSKSYMPYTPDADDPEGWFETHEYGQSPVFHFRTATPYGISELEDVYGAQNLLTKQIATLASATEGYGWPLRAALSKAGTLGDRSAAIGWDDQQNVPAGSQLNSRQRGPNIQTRPGDLIQLHDTDALVSLPPADVNNFVQPIELALTLVNTVSGKNVYSHNQSRADASGVAQQERDRPLVKIVEAYQRLFGAELVDMYEFALRLLGAPSTDVTVTWSEAQLTDDVQSAQTAAAKQAAGVPQDETLVEMGYLPSKVLEWSKGTELTNLETRVDLVGKIGTALQGLGAAQQLGVVDPGMVQAVLNFVLKGVISSDDDEDDPQKMPAVPPVADPVPADGGA
jgi:hypothetical protein